MKILQRIHLCNSLLVFIVSITLLSCSKSGTMPVTPVDPGTPVDSTPAQYGTPFANVPDRQDVSIYQVNMRIFSAAGNFQGVTDRLDSIKALGVNVIYLMPIYPVGILKAFNSPYSVRDYLGVNTEFGTLADLRAIVDGAHSRGMAVLFDWVGNHTSWDNAWITSNPSWYKHDANGNIVSPAGYSDVAQLDFTNADMRLAMIKDMKYWVYTANIDGYRCDFADNIPADFWQQALDSVRNITTHKFLFLAEGSRSANYTAGFDYNFGFNFYGQLKTIYSSDQSVLNINSLNVSDYAGTSGTQQIVRYLTNHDVDGSDGAPINLFGGANGETTAFIVVAYMKGVPFIYNGQEVGDPIQHTFPFTSTKIAWSSNLGLETTYKNIIAFRNSSVAIRRGQLTSFSTADVCAFTKVDGSDSVMVISNLRNQISDFPIPAALQNSNWTDVFNGGAFNLGTDISLLPYAYFVLKIGS